MACTWLATISPLSGQASATSWPVIGQPFTSFWLQTTARLCPNNRRSRRARIWMDQRHLLMRHGRIGPEPACSRDRRLRLCRIKRCRTDFRPNSSSARPILAGCPDDPRAGLRASSAPHCWQAQAEMRAHRTCMRIGGAGADVREEAGADVREQAGSGRVDGRSCFGATPGMTAFLRDRRSGARSRRRRVTESGGGAGLRAPCRQRRLRPRFLQARNHTL